MIKKIANFLLVIASVLSIGITAAAAGYSERDSGLLEQLGIIEESPSEDYIVTRAEYLGALLRAMNIPLVTGDSEPIFTDMTKSHTGYSAVITAYYKGMIKGYRGQFRPDDYITADEAMIMAVNAMSNAAVPEDTVRFISDRAGLFDGLAYKKTVSYSEMSRLLCNMLLSDTFRCIPSANGVEVSFDEKENFLEKIWDIYQYEGTVEAADGVSIYGNLVRSDVAVIGGREFYIEMFSVNELLGMDVKLFYSDTDGEEAVVYAYAKKNNKTIEYTYHEFFEYSSSQLKFYEDKKEKNYRVDQKTTYIYNNRLLKSGEISTKLSSMQGSYRMIDNNSDNIYDVVIIFTSDVYVPKAVDYERETIVDDTFGTLDLSEYASYVITDVRGKAVSLENIKKDSRILVYNPGDTGYTIRIVILEDSQNCTVTGKKTDGDEKIIVVDGVTDYLVSAYTRFAYDSFEQKTRYTIYFDGNGEIVDAEVLSRDVIIPVYIAKMVYSESDERVWADVMKSDGKFERVEFADKVSVRIPDGSVLTAKTQAELYSIMLNGNERVERQLVFAEYTPENRIRKLLQVSENPNDSYHIQDYEENTDSNGTGKLATSRRWVSQIYSFSNQVQLKSTTKVFFAPYTTILDADEKLMGVTTVSSFSNDQNYAMYDPATSKGYKLVPIIINPEELAADYLVIECPEGKTFGVSKRISGVVLEMVSEWDETESELVYKLTLMQYDGTNIEYRCEESVASRVSEGDIIEIKYISGTVRDADVLLYYDASEEKMKITSSFDQYDSDNKPIDGDNLIGWRYYAETRLTQGEVLEVKGNYAKLNTLQNKINLEEIVDISAARILKFNITTGRYEEFDGGYLKQGDKYVALLKHGKMMCFIFYEK